MNPRRSLIALLFQRFRAKSPSFSIQLILVCIFYIAGPSTSNAGDAGVSAADGESMSNLEADPEEKSSFFEDLDFSEGPGFETLEDSRDQIYEWIDIPVTWLDKKLSGDVKMEEEPIDTKFRLQPYFVYQRKASSKFSFDIDYSSEIRLRRLQHKLKLIVETGELGALPDTSPEDEDRDTRIGISKMIQRHLNFRVGTQVKWPPVAYGSIRWARAYHYEDWMFYPSSEVFYRSNNVKFGSTTNAPFGRWWGNHLFRSASGVRIAGNTDGFNWASAWNYGYSPNLIEYFESRPLVGPMDFAKGTNLMYRISGTAGEDNVVTEHQVSLTFRYPLRGNWLFIYAVPEIRWQKENDWGPEYRVRIGFDALFWGGSTDRWDPNRVR